jgi:hypothetical protein
MQYGQTAMQARRWQQAPRVLLALAVLLASVSTARLAAPTAGHPTSHLRASRTLPGIEPAILRDRLPVVRPPVERLGQSGRLLPVLIGVLVAAVAVVCGLRAGRPCSSGLARARALARATLLEARAPPFLQPA